MDKMQASRAQLISYNHEAHGQTGKIGDASGLGCLLLPTSRHVYEFSAFTKNKKIKTSYEPKLFIVAKM
jgi:hypothetical protein